MLLVEHRAPHLYREDAFREYCWSVDAYGSYQPASFIYLCFESFMELCASYGLWLAWPPGTDSSTRDVFPWRHEREARPKDWRPVGLVLRLETLGDADRAVEMIRQGGNVLALVPSEMFDLYYRGDESRIRKSIEAFAALGVHMDESTFRQTSRAMQWQEVPICGPGRLFVTKDRYLSDGYFMPGYGKSPENAQRMRDLVASFATFTTPLIRICPRSAPTTWPTGEPLSVVLDVWNHGPPLTSAVLTLDVDPAIEPLSPLERAIGPLGTLQRTCFAVQVMPRVDGTFALFTGAACTTKDGQQVTVRVEESSLTVLPGHAMSFRSMALQDDQGLHRLQDALRRAGFRVQDAKKLVALLTVDSRACANRIRAITERLLLRVLERTGAQPNSAALHDLIREISDRKLVTRRTISYLHTIRVIGNIASHASNEPIRDDDVRIISYALACACEELLERKLL